MVQRGIITQEGEAGPEQSSAGGTPAVQGALRAMQKNRRYETTAARTGATAPAAPGAPGTPTTRHLVSMNERVIYHRDFGANPRGPTGAPTLQPQQVEANIHAHAVPIQGTATNTIDVTGDQDRSILPDTVGP
jgi:hypothetical protein